MPATRAGQSREERNMPESRKQQEADAAAEAKRIMEAAGRAPATSAPASPAPDYPPPSPAEAKRIMEAAGRAYQPPASPDVPAAPANVEPCGMHYQTGSGDELICRKPKGHGDGDLKELGKAHSSRQPKERLNFEAVNLDELSSEFAPEDEVVTGVQDTGPRSAQQQNVDGQVLEAVTWWRENGKPVLVLSKGKGRRRMLVSPANAEAVREMLKQAGIKHGVRVARSAPIAHESGNKLIYWFATDRKSRESKPDSK